MAVSLLLLELGAGEGNLLSIDDDDEVTHVHVRSEGSLVLSAEQDGCVAGETTEDDVGCVDDDPFPLDVVGLGRICARHNSAAFIDRVRCS